MESYKVGQATFYVPSVADKQESEQEQKPAQLQGRSVSNASDNAKSLTMDATARTSANKNKPLSSGDRAISISSVKDSIQVIPLNTSQLPTTMKVIDRDEAAKQQHANSSTDNNPNLQREDDQVPIYAKVNKRPKK